MNYKVFILLILCVGCKSVKVNQQKKADRIFQAKIKHVELFYNLEEGYSQELLEASQFLEKLTNLKSKYAYHYSGVEPQNNSDLMQWKAWYKANRHLLHWDKNKRIVIVKSSNTVVK